MNPGSVSRRLSFPAKLANPVRTTGAMPLVVVFIPALNEEEKIGEVITTVKKLYADPKKLGFRIQVVVVDDGSTDGTVAAAEKSGADRIISHPRNLGLGAATRTGLKMAHQLRADVALKLDADFQHDPEDIAKVIRPILEKRAHIVYGSRFAGKIHYKMPLIRRWGNRFFTWLMRRLTGWPITDAQTGLMVYSREYLADFNMPGDYNPPHQTLIDAFHRNLTYAEVPVEFHPRTTGKSFVSLKYPMKALPQMVRTLMLVCPLKVFVPAGIFFLCSGVAVGCVEGILYSLGKMSTMHDASIAVLIIFGVQCLFFGLLADLIIMKK